MDVDGTNKWLAGKEGGEGKEKDQQKKKVFKG